MRVGFAWLDSLRWVSRWIGIVDAAGGRPVYEPRVPWDPRAAAATLPRRSWEPPGLPRPQDAGPGLGCLYSQRIIRARGRPPVLTTRYWLVTVCGSGLLLVQVTVSPTKTVSRWSEMLEQVPPV